MIPTQPALSIDFYKADHRSQYQPRTELVYSIRDPQVTKLYHLPTFAHRGTILSRPRLLLAVDRALLTSKQGGIYA